MQRLFFQRYFTTKSGQRGWRRYLDRLKERPASHITAFAILHEVTAILPFPLIYFPLKWSRIGDYLPLPMEYIQGQFIYHLTLRSYLDFCFRRK
jgi:hypothetical protein